MDDNKQLIYEFLGLNTPFKKGKTEDSIVEKILHNKILFLAVALVAYKIGMNSYLDLYAPRGGRIWCMCFYILINGLMISMMAMREGGAVAPIYVPVISSIIGTEIVASLHQEFVSTNSWIVQGLFIFNIIQGAVWVLSLWGPEWIFLQIHSEKSGKYLRAERKIEEREKKEKIYEQLTSIKDERVIRYIGRAIELYNEGDYEDAIANIRKVLECHVYMLVECHDFMFKEEKELQIFNILKYLDDRLGYPDYVEELHKIRKACNSKVHVSGEVQSEVTKESTYDLINKMLNECTRYSNYYDNNERCIKLEEKATTCFEKSKKHMENGNYEDALLNLRKTLECIIYGYIKRYHIICTYGHEDNISGYIDMLYDRKIIGKQSKHNMHKVRGVSNKAVHMQKIEDVRKNAVELYHAMEKEMQIYSKNIKNILDFSNYSILSDVIKTDESESNRDDYEPEYYGNREMSMGKYRQQYDYEDDYEEPVKRNEERELMPSEMVDPYKQTDPYRANDPYVQSCPPEEYYIKW